MPSGNDDLRALLLEGKELATAGRRWSDRSGPDRDGVGWAWSRRDGEAPSVVDDRPESIRGRGLSGRATPTLQETWIDPEETPFVPVPRPGKAVPARLFSLTVTAAILFLLAWLIVPEVSFRLTSINTVFVKQGVLTAQAVPIAPTRPATVEKLFVDSNHLPDGLLPAGTPIARLSVANVNGFGASSVDMSVPFAARFVSVDTLEGAVTLPGTPVATVYDPKQMYVIVTVQPKTLETLRRGMRAKLSSPLVKGKIKGTVISAVPLLGTDHDPATSELVNVRIKPDDGRIVDLVPGIRFDAAIDLSSAPPGAEPLVVADGRVAGGTAAGSEKSGG